MIKKNSQQARHYELKDLLYIMSRLRDPETGCPWDIKQSWESITSSTIEEAYEVVEAIESGDRSKISEELGDLLFQVVFYSQLAQEETVFDFHQVVSQLCDKLVRRHPHVFPGGELESVRDGSEEINESQIKQDWESIKQVERNNKGQSGLLADIGTNLPSLTRAFKLQKRAASVGFDWQDIGEVVAKFKEELDEFEEALHLNTDRQAIEDELGDVLFTCVNLARFLELDAEKTMRRANRKFENRLAHVEKELETEGLTIAECSRETLQAFWNRAKQAGL